MSKNLYRKVNKEYWQVLQKIMELKLKTLTTEPIKYHTGGVVDGNDARWLGESEEELIVKKLEEMGAFKIKGGKGYYNQPYL
jgi:hypothetical protein